MSAVLIKLINGEELIANVIHEDKNVYIFREPMAIEQRALASGGTIDVLVNYVNMANTFDVEIKKSHVLCVTLVDKKYDKYYEISKTYHAKHVRPNLLEEVTKVTDAMEEVLYSSVKLKDSKIVSTSLASNNTIH